MELQRRFVALNEGVDPAELQERMRSTQAGDLLRDLLDALEAGTLRLVQMDVAGSWSVQVWIKRALMALGGGATVASQPGVLPGSELDRFGWSAERPTERRVPAGSFVRRGAHLAPGVTLMPPATVQAGAAILAGAAIDSHVLIGTGVVVGEGAVVGCGTMLAGALQPEHALPVILERGAVVGGNCGLYGSILVGAGASIFAGSVIRATGGVFQISRREWLLPDAAGTLRLPAGCTVSMGMPPAERFPDGIQRLTPLLAD